MSMVKSWVQEGAPRACLRPRHALPRGALFAAYSLRGFGHHRLSVGRGVSTHLASLYGVVHANKDPVAPNDPVQAGSLNLVRHEATGVGEHQLDARLLLLQN